MRVGIISGTGAYEWPGLRGAERLERDTPFGPVGLTGGEVGGVEVVHLSRHGTGHVRLSNNVNHRANIGALLACGVDCLVSLTVCGAIDATATLGSLVVFDDLFFPTNRLPDGSLCTWYDRPGAEGRGHWIFGDPFDESMRSALLQAAALRSLPVVPKGCYGHVDGPRFNSRSEISWLGALGVTAVSQTAAAEVVLAGEAELPMALVGYLTDFANGVAAEPEPVEALIARADASTGTFASLLEQALPRLVRPSPAGTVYRFGASAGADGDADQHVAGPLDVPGQRQHGSSERRAR
jgi:5'-methylthioadenosine phosphorylase